MPPLRVQVWLEWPVLPSLHLFELVSRRSGRVREARRIDAVNLGHRPQTRTPAGSGFTAAPLAAGPLRRASRTRPDLRDPPLTPTRPSRGTSRRRRSPP